jgi:putative glycosyltransferase (TIGR04372 family)
MKKLNLKKFIKKNLTVLRILLSIPVYLISILILPFIVLIKGWYTIRVDHLRSIRIGPFAFSIQNYLNQKKNYNTKNNKKNIDLLFLHEISNTQLEKMIRRNVIILPRFFLEPLFIIIKFLSNYFQALNDHKIDFLNTDRDSSDSFVKSNSKLNFTQNEELKGENFLKKFNLTSKSKIVCLLVRDSGYLEKNFSNNFSYHDYRNGNIKDYIPAVESMIRRGYFVFRMGKDVVSKLTISNNKYCDYASSNFRSDFLDIYLGSKCTFLLSSSCGYQYVPMIFNKPMACISIPIGYTYTWVKNCLNISKHIYSEEKKRNLTLKEIISSSIGVASTIDVYKSAKLKIIDNDPDEIKDLAEEMMDRLEDKFKINEEDRKIQEEFWAIFKSSPHNQLKSFQGVYKKAHSGFRAKIAKKFLKNNFV